MQINVRGAMDAVSALNKNDGVVKMPLLKENLLTKQLFLHMLTMTR